MQNKNTRQTVSRMRNAVTLVLGFLVVFAGVISLQILQSGQKNNQVLAQEKSTLRQSVLIQINTIRSEHKLSLLNENELLQNAAQSKAEDMIRHGYFAHIRPEDNFKWSDFIDIQQYNYHYAGENLAKGYTNTDSMIQAWMNSPSHRENILSSDFEETGIGFSFQPDENGDILYVVQMFAKK